MLSFDSDDALYLTEARHTQGTRDDDQSTRNDVRRRGICAGQVVLVPLASPHATSNVALAPAHADGASVGHPTGGAQALTSGPAESSARDVIPEELERSARS